MPRGIILNYHGEIKGYGYRRARIEKVAFEVRPDDVDYDEIHERLCRRAGMMMDNHQTFLLVESGIAVQLSDGNIWIGTGLREERW